MKLSKRIPARTKTLTAAWLKKDFIEMSPEYRAIRSHHKDSMDSCYWCGHKFADGEMIALAGTKGKNRVLCQSCAEVMLESEESAKPA